MSIYAVNGKEPVAAWIPSLDTAGNGTTTLTDLVGSANGTLTNMDAATDWVVDTDAGGVRALDFDGSNDYVTFGNVHNLTTTRTLSLWVYSRSSTGTLLSHRTVGTTWDWYFGTSRPSLYQGGSGSDIETADTTITLNEWTHLACVLNGGTVYWYLNGVADGSDAMYTSLGTSTALTLGRFGSGRYLNGLVDDIRIWDQALDSTDITDLYASGFGRGITFGATGNPTSNLNNTIRTTRQAL